jgi:hypothetical protein
MSDGDDAYLAVRALAHQLGADVAYRQARRANALCAAPEQHAAIGTRQHHAEITRVVVGSTATSSSKPAASHSRSTKTWISSLIAYFSLATSSAACGPFFLPFRFAGSGVMPFTSGGRSTVAGIITLLLRMRARGPRLDNRSGPAFTA